MFFARVHVQRDGAPFGQAQRGFEAFGQALLAFRLDAQSIDHHVDIVLFGFLKRRKLVDV